MSIVLRLEHAKDLDDIRQLTQAAFAGIAYSSHTEHFIIDALRERQKLTLSLVAVVEEQVVGHVAISPVQLSTQEQGWYGLGPISVLPQHQGQGIGSALMIDVLNRLQILGAQGCVLLGNPHYYEKFGFQAHPNLHLADVPPEYFQALSFTEQFPKADVFYDQVFYMFD